MTIYNTYQEAKLAMPLACIIEDTDSGLFFGMPTREGTTLAGGSRFAEPQYYCMTVEKFLADGYKFVEGDVVSNLDGGVSTVNYSSRVKSNDDYCLEYMNYPEDGDEKRYILRAAALENQMNIDNLATQTPEEKEALDLIDTTPHQYEMSKFSGKKEIEWSDSDELPPVGCEVMTSYTDNGCDDWCDFHGPSIIIAYHGDYVWVAHHGKFNRVHELCSIEFEKVEKETPQQREERERLEAAYDLYCHAIDLDTPFDKFCNFGPLKDIYIKIVDKTNYRKESN